MEIADITAFKQTGEGVAWASLNNLSVKDNRYAYSVINGSSKGTAKPKNLLLSGVKFNINSFDSLQQEFYIEYKMYLDETSVPNNFSLLKRPDILITFYDGSTHLIHHEDYANDDFNDILLTKNERITANITLNHLINPFDVEFIFEEYKSAKDEEVTVMIDYARVKIVNWVKENEFVLGENETYFYPIMNNGGLTIEAGINDAVGEVTIGQENRIGVAVYNKREDEKYTIFLPNDVSKTNAGYVTQNGYFENFDTLNNCITFVATEITDVNSMGFIYVDFKRIGTTVIYLKSNYDDDCTLTLTVNPPALSGLTGGKGALVKERTNNNSYIYKCHLLLPVVGDEEYADEIDSIITTPQNITIGDIYLVRQGGWKLNEGYDRRHPYYVKNSNNNLGITIWNHINNVDEVYVELELITGQELVDGNVSLTFSYEGNTFSISPYVSNVIDNSFTAINLVPYVVYSKKGTNNTVWIGGDEYSEFTFSAHSGNYFKFNKPAHQISVGYPIAYIGAVRLNRGHKADVTASTTNSSSREVYQNRAYLGKKGDWNGKISMTLRIPWRDVVTLQNHTKHDYPIAIDTCPDLPDGDPLNHRGWAEIYGVSNIKKINEFLYQCDVDVEYLTHELLGKFTINQLNRICPVDIDYNITNSHQYHEDLRNVLDLSSFKDFSNLLIDKDSYKGVYTVPSGSTYKFTTLNPVSTISDWSFRWRNILPRIDSSAYDNDNWNMAFRVVDKETRQLFFEYMYTNFTHINENDELLNECDVKVTRLNNEGNYEITNYHHMNLDFDEMNASLYKDRANTSIQVQEYIETTERGHNVQFKLIDWNGNPLYDKFVDVNVFTDDGEELQSFTTITNSNGVGEFEFNQNQGVYRIQFKYMGDDKYNESYAESRLYMNILYNTATFFDIANNQTFTTKGKYFTGKLYSGANVPLANRKVKVYVKKSTSKKWWTPYVKTTDDYGEFNLQINLIDGLYDIKCVYEGESTYNKCYETVKIKVKSGSGTATRIISSDLTVPATDVLNKTYSFDIILQTEKGTPIANQQVVMTFYSEMWKQTVSYTKTTNSNGVASIQIRLNSGVYYVDVSYDGINKKYKPCNASNMVYVKASESILTELTMKDLYINDCLHHELEAVLEDEFGNRLVNYPVRFEITNLSTNKVIKYTHLTNYEGMAELNINLSSGSYKTQAFFEGQNKYAPTKTGQRSMIIKRPARQQVTHILDNQNSFAQNEPIHFYAKDSQNQPIAGLPVSVYIYDENTKELENGNIAITNAFVNSSNVAEYETDANGLLSFIPQLNAGYYTVRIVTYCTDNYEGKETSYKIYLSASQRMETILTPLWTNDVPFVLNTPPYSGDRVEVLLTDENHNPLSYKTIRYHLDFPNDAQDYYKTTDGNGIAYLTLNLSARTNLPITIYFEGDGGYAESNISGTINVNSSYSPITNVTPQSYSATATITLLDYSIDSTTNTYIQNVVQFPHYTQVRVENSSNQAMPNQQVAFIVYGENKEENTYYRTTDENGIATLEFLQHDNNNYPVVIQLVSDVYYAKDITFNYIVNVQKTDSITSNTVIDRSDMADGLTILETPNPETYDGAEYGSTLEMFFNNNVLEIHDFGLIQDTSMIGGKINIDNIILPDSEYDIEIATTYNSQDNFTEELLGTMQVQVNEVKNINQYKSLYSNLICSPAILIDHECKFVRDGEDGRLYYYDVSKNDITRKYRLSPFLQYKGGVNLETENGISLFDLETSITPIIVENGLVKVAFHKNSGYIYIYRYNYSINGYEYCVDNSEWVLVRILKINDYDYFNLDYYNLDKISITFGKTQFTIYRGRPFIEVKHENEDIYFTKQVGRVYCETEKNGFIFTPVDDSIVDIKEAEFFTNNAVNLFPYNLYISENMRLDNFVPTVAELELVDELDKKKGLKATNKGYSNRMMTVMFPKSKIELPSKKVTLLINRLKTSVANIRIQILGFTSEDDDEGDVLINQSVASQILSNGELNQVRTTFNLTDEQFNSYSHFAFSIRLYNTNVDDYVILNQIMLYEGNDEIPYEADNTEYRLNNTEIYFENNYYAKFYNKSDDFGLCVVRPYLDSLKLGYIPKSKLTVLIPYMKHNSSIYDSPEMVSVEYLYSKDEITKIQGEDYGI